MRLQMRIVAGWLRSVIEFAVRPLRHANVTFPLPDLMLPLPPAWGITV
jgi:hypothetical protein